MTYIKSILVSLAVKYATAMSGEQIQQLALWILKTILLPLSKKTETYFDDKVVEFIISIVEGNWSTLYPNLADGSFEIVQSNGNYGIKFDEAAV